VLPCRASSTAAGSSNFNAVDRLAIENVIGSYSYLVDNNKIDAWLELFTADSVFETHIPGEPPEVLSFHQLSELANTCFAAFAKAGNQRRHLMAIVTFEDQTADSAHVFVEALITNAHDGKVFTSVSSDQYEGWFTKVDGIWKIKHWIDAPDVALPGG
jgi:hypothetical protein